MAPIRVAIAGTGGIARVHIEALRALSDQATVVAATDIDTDRASAFCARHGISERYGTLADLLADARPDLVHICTPPGAHASQALSCLRAGSSVLVEKPPALSLHELSLIAAAERERGPWFATVFQHRFGSGAQRLKSLADSGCLGRPLLALCNTTWFRDQAYFDEPWRGRWDTEGGGPTMGHGIHQIDLLAYVMGDWVEVSGLARRQARQTQTEDLSLAQVTFASGAVASIVNSVISPREESYLRFDFERATVEVTHLYGYSDADWRITPVPGYADEVLAAWDGGAQGIASGHRAQFAAVLAALQARSAPPVTSASVTNTMSLVTGIYASALTGQPIGRGELSPESPYWLRMDGDGGGLSRLDGPVRPAESVPATSVPAQAPGAPAAARQAGAARSAEVHS
ncbi:MAG TPA: Gfo/Idh/MocA family oxidoreductase [Streptosporangiaceae bacterium]